MNKINPLKPYASLFSIELKLSSFLHFSMSIVKHTNNLNQLSHEWAYKRHTWHYIRQFFAFPRFLFLFFSCTHIPLSYINFTASLFLKLVTLDLLNLLSQEKILTREIRDFTQGCTIELQAFSSKIKRKWEKRQWPLV